MSLYLRVSRLDDFVSLDLVGIAQTVGKTSNLKSLVQVSNFVTGAKQTLAKKICAKILFDHFLRDRKNLIMAPSFLIFQVGSKPN